ncbi:orotidine-5'-phosphate decarboxylase [Desulfofundulus thermosubterraneus]|uniref:Orotidine 5'-phosphate decarboxylase n=1 Tax=Desulfofundulus thermosubterraneus DSM 16057 TaxID=1121432 RepID=A0A1M6BS64_9FIRM|nr:orotidine-5'-phosphate decarboxylase [Desulfofundulus thermosubterraneus]SHI51630.1 orotidine-5'-phosphate decarboxylase [Desulfofundulus thermosubterraneus DSM 16057]
MNIDEAREKLIVALDVESTEQALDLVEQLKPWAGMFKVGMQLFYSQGPAVIKDICRQGVKVFLDLKLHDIPNTVAQAVRVLTRLGVTMFNVHAAGGRAMMRAALESCGEESTALGIPRPLVVAVTVLTSIDQLAFNRELGLSGPVLDRVVAWALLAKECGLDGVVASAQEAAAIRQSCGPDFLIITPGIRPAGAAGGDQKRIVTPAGALAAGASRLVVGRPIIGAPEPVKAARAILSEMVVVVASSM